MADEDPDDDDLPGDDELAEDEDDDDEDEDESASSIEDLGLPMPVLAPGVALELLTRGELTLVGRLWASTNNAHAVRRVAARGR